MSQKQYERVQSYIHKGIEEGAELLVGGEGHPSGFDAGCFVKPTVFVNVRSDMTIAQEEIFGPVFVCRRLRYRGRRDLNRQRHKIGAPPLRERDRHPARGARGLSDAGRPNRINGMLDDPDAPWGGFKYSGVGREFGRYGIEAFLETRVILE